MKTFKQFSESMSHPNGTYSALYLSSKSANSLLAWCKKNDIKTNQTAKELHSTLVYSKVGIPQAKEIKIKLPVKANIIGWELFKSQSGTNCLVARLGPNKFWQDLHNLYYGGNYPEATYDFPSYKPHVTLNSDYGESKIPNVIPAFNLLFSSHKFVPLED